MSLDLNELLYMNFLLKEFLKLHLLQRLILDRDYFSSQKKLFAITAGRFAPCGMRRTRL